MLDDKDEFKSNFFEGFSVPYLRGMRAKAASHLTTKDFVPPISEEELRSWVQDIDAELVYRGICNVCWRMACSC
jgi:hypothetical protein